MGLIGLISLLSLPALGQIKIGGNVYGGGNHAEVRGSSRVTVTAGNIGAVLDPRVKGHVADPQGRVFGGARMADVKGSSFVHIDGENATDYILINYVFGGNDIAGHIGTAKAVGDTIPEELTEVRREAADLTNEKLNTVDKTFNSYVRVSTKTAYTAAEIAAATEGDPAYGKTAGVPDYYTQEEITAALNPDDAAYGKRTTDIKPPTSAKKIYIGQLFGGGNGDYTYLDENGDSLRDGDDYIAKQGDIIIARSKTPLFMPEQDKTYLEIKGGSIVYGYGGGNNATVKEKNIIHFDNPSAVVNSILVDKDGKEANSTIYATYEASKTAEKPEGVMPEGYSNLLTNARFMDMGINLVFSQPSSGAYQVGRFFGGNNKAEMHIRPTWNLLAGKIRNLYSGGNRGAMTSPDGLLLEIKDYSSLIVDNLYGGCRMADVKPSDGKGDYTPCTNLPGYRFPNELSARTLVRGGYVHNVYGGNDVTGTVYGGNAVGIYTAVYGNVYGGGNGVYPYTDNEYLQNDSTYGDFYYDPGSDTYAALNAFRPNAEQVSIRLNGKDARHQTIIHGSVFVGGNCASLDVKKKNPLIELKMGSYVVCDNVYLGNNGEGMIDTTYLKLFAPGAGHNSWDLTDKDDFSKYMEGVAMTQKPSIVFDKIANGDPADYIDFSSYVGSFFCGGNVGSMAIPGKMTINIDRALNIYNKFVGGCNNADVVAREGLNAYYEGGIIGSEDERGDATTNTNYYTEDGTEGGKIKDRLEINFRNMTVMPLRWNDTFTQVPEGTKLTWGKEYYHTDLRSTKFISDGTEEATEDSTYYELTNIGNRLIWNTAKWSIDEDNFVSVPNNAVNDSTRLIEGNVYGGCYNSGHVNGNIVINVDEDVLKKDDIFGTGTSEFFGHEKSGVNFEDQRDDVMAVALSVFGAGHGEKTEVWGSTTANLNKGYTLQIFGGGELGVVGKRKHNANGDPIVDGEGNYSYEFDPRYSTTVNLNAMEPVYSKDGTSQAEAEYLYAGGNEGLIAGNTLTNLGNGRIYDAFGGSSDADILGHTEVYIGRQPNGSGGYKDGFPFIRDIVYGGNDFGGTIEGEFEDGYDFTKRVKDYETDKTQIHGYKADEIPEVLKSSSYVEYLQGRVDSIFGGGYGAYDYADTLLYGNDAAMPDQHSSYVNIRPNDHAQNALKAVFGGGTGYPGNRAGDKAQDRSYVLVDIPDGMETFSKMEVFGAGSYNGVGMRYHLDTETGKTLDEEDNPVSSLDEASAITDLLRGHIKNAYGGSYQEGVTRRTVVNVPENSSIQIDSIFGGAYGRYILPPCDVYETQVNYNNTSEKAQTTAIFGGNNKERRALFTQVNISSPVYSNKAKGYTATVYGAGKGIDTWSEHTEVNLLSGARVYKVYGGGEMGHVLNSASIQAYMNLYKTGPSPQISEQDPYWKVHKDDMTAGGATQTAAEARWAADWKDAWTLGSYYEPGKSNGETAGTAYTKYATNKATNLDHFSDRAELDDKIAAQLDGRKKHNTNVIINKGAVVEGYAYGGGLGDVNTYLSGDIYGTTYVAVLGGEVNRDVYAGGEAGGVDNLFGAEEFSVSSNKFVASANAYVQGGTVRNVYGGGYKGHVGHHTGDITQTFVGDRPAEAYVVVGKSGDGTYESGVPAITRNVYGGGEGGSVYGSSEVNINNGYIGYRYKGFLAVPKGTELTEGATYYTSAKGDGKFTAKGTETSTGSNYYEETYAEELDDQATNDIEMAGNVFGGGYVINSYVDSVTVNMYGGTVRGSLYGGGELGPIGRGAVKTGFGRGLVNGDATIFKAGTTNVNLYDGLVKRNVFGGGRGKDSWGGDGTMYMDKSVVASLKSGGLFCKGYVFGQTRVNIRGGEIGTEEGMEKGYGNVFGGGDEGTVYSALHDKTGALHIGLKNGERYKDVTQGYYYESADGTNYLKNGDDFIFTEDCKVVVEPYSKALLGVTVGDSTYKAGEYVLISDLNKLKGKNEEPKWTSLDTKGVIIHNAVFAGGNLAAGSSSLYANAKTVYGNATASIHDVYNRDLITIGTGHTGGLYGDGNLTFVDGYRELNITNYGTDYYHIAKSLTYDEYKVLPEREKAYYELKYKCLVSCTDNAGTTYGVGSTLSQDEILDLFAGNTTVIVDGKPSSTYWKEEGVVSVYAGRIMNTIQRADLCGVFGSRMVMRGAQDRVPEEADYTNYTINRVREVSLNKKDTQAGDPATIIEGGKTVENPNYQHGNYFGIYSKVNYLGALTSDVRFDTIRTTKSDDASCAADGKSFYAWKEENKTHKKRNNGNCHNHLALASGVYLELTTEESTGNTLDTKVWGPITGVVELDLINVQPGMGGGFVYAKNIHGKPKDMRATRKTTTLTDLNKNAVTKWEYDYIETNPDLTGADAEQMEWETSGNFIHSSQTIVDDCYNISNRYELGKNPMPAHYWYIAGSVYVYDQYISAYTGSPNAFRETVGVPIAISAAAHGTMTLLDVQPNYYAYYQTYTSESSNTPLGSDQKIVINDVTYKKNDPISYWDWNKLTTGQKQLFVKETYVTSAGCKIGNDTIYAGTVMIPGAADKPGTYEAYKAAAATTTIAEKTVKVVTSNGKEVPFDEIFRSSNNMSHNNGYLLTYNVTNPEIWDKWYTLKENNSARAKDQTGGSAYEDGPTYYPTDDGLYGQQSYDVNAIIPNTIYNDYQTLTTSHTVPSGQATFVPAYLVTKEYDSGANHYYPGAPVSTAKDGFTSDAYVSTATIQLSETEYIYVNDLMTETEKNNLKTKYSSLATEIENSVKPAYICTTAGLYGGKYYLNANNYRALEAYSAMSPKDREFFKFNYDALDLLVDSLYGGTVGQKYQYDSEAATLAGAKANDAHYSLTRPINYIATYTGSNYTGDKKLPSKVTVKRGSSTISTDQLQTNDTLQSTEFEKLPNEQHHYAAIRVEQTTSDDTLVYVVKESFVHGDKAYAVGTTINDDTYGSLTTTERENYITGITFTKAQSNKTYYYCREPYVVGEKGGGVTPAIVNIDGYTGGGIVQTTNQKDSVTVGTIINENSNGGNKGYDALPNYQTKFTIQGESPMETSTLYVARNADINDLSTEKIITVIYRYDYEESDDDGAHVTPVTERHVLNIHITFKSGVPTVEDINPPTTVLPGTGITMRIPSVTPGAYEITGGGWEIYEKEDDAESHINGVPYTPSVDPLYWYQDGFYLAYYAKTYLGKTYSNHVPVSVANYHDLKEVMDDKANHLHVDYDHSRLQRSSKIYINDYSASSENGLDLFKDLYDLSLLNNESEGVTDGVVTAAGRLNGHSLLNTETRRIGTEDVMVGVKGGENLEFILRTDINHSASWTTIGTDDVCFKGNLHGDGHTISGLNNSLFYNLCGSVYNLGVTGSFKTAGVADKGVGYVESAWTKTSAASTDLSPKPYPVFGAPSDDKGYQVVNSYYYNGNKGLYTTTEGDAEITYTNGSKGNVKGMSANAFYNGELAYNLNNFYLYKRYNDGVSTASGVNYKYFTLDAIGNIPTPKTPQSGYYASSNEKYCSSGFVDSKSNAIKYVEERYGDGDFIYAEGEVPTIENERHWVDTLDNNKSYYFPIWPDDYIFFGQSLTYGWAAEAHDSVPTAVARDEGRLSTGTDANRVYRAPAYYRSKDMGVTHFNPHAYLVQQEKLTDEQIEYNETHPESATTPRDAYPNMTAIDFKGHYEAHEAYGAYHKGNEGGLFYTPLLDDDGLLSIRNCDETQNIVVYAPAADANAKTYGVLNSYFTEPAYSAHYDDTKGYRLVTEASAASVHGHLVQSNKKTTNDHLLVDYQDFNAPILYTLGEDYRMWYQRLPLDREYVDLTKGWQGISIPFTAELVTTDTKGEITHFYKGSTKGHEYWLRQLGDEITATEDAKVLKAKFDYPDATGPGKTATNTFLWNYYYKNESVHNQLDKNADTYLQYRQYYKESRPYTGYSLLQAATPYIIGFPGSTYYEFDLSGNFDAKNTAVSIPKLSKQVITFASDKAAVIGVSDDEMTGTTVTYTAGSTNYTFKPSYMNRTLTHSEYVMNSEGNAYVQLNSDAVTYNTTGSTYETKGEFDAAVAEAGHLYSDADGTVEASWVNAETTYYKRVSVKTTKNDENHVTESHSAFRPYFTTSAVSSAKGMHRAYAKKIIFTGTDNELREGPETVLDGSLEIFTRGYNIVTRSHMKEAVAIRIVTAAGATFSDFVLQPGETIETTVPNTGVYVVNKKKVFVE